MFTRSKRIAPRAIAPLAAILSTAGPVSAQVSTVFDPVGDAFYFAPPFQAPAFQDIVLVRMTKTAGGDFELLMEVAGPVPVAPPLPAPGVREILWAWGFDLDPALPQGYPAAPGFARWPEFLVYVTWDGTEFAGTAIDRRPLLTGGEAIITPVPFSINGTSLQAHLDYTLIGDVPPSFGWGFVTQDWLGPVGSSAFFYTDGGGGVFNP